MKVLTILATSNRSSFPGCCIIKQLTGLSKDALENLQSKASKENNDGPIFVKTSYSSEEMQLLQEQMNYYGLAYEVDEERGNINFIGAKDEDGNVLAQAPYPKLKSGGRTQLPGKNKGKWNKKSEDSEEKPSRGNGRFMPNANEKPKGHPVNIPNDLDNPYLTDAERNAYKKNLDKLSPSKKEEQLGKIKDKKERNKETQKQRNEDPNSQPKDLGLTLYDKDGNPIRYPWGTPGEEIIVNPGPPQTITPATVISQVEYLVNEHRKRNGLPADYVFTGVLYENNAPIMDEFSMGTVEMEFFTSDRDLNFSRADELIAEQLNAQGKTIIDEKTGFPRPYTADDVEKYREKNDLTWHEDPSCSKMMKVPTILHANVPHSGGISDVTAEGQESFYGGDDMVKSQKDAIKAQNAADKALTNHASDAAEKQAKADEAQAVFDKKAAPTVERQAKVVEDAKSANANAKIKVNTPTSTAGADKGSYGDTGKDSDGL